MTSMPYMPAPMPPGRDLAELHVEERDEPGDRLGAVMPGVDGAGARAGRGGHEQAADRRAEADLLAFHVADAGLVDAGREERVADELDVHRDDGADEQDRSPSRRRSSSPGAGLPAYRPKV